jgi:lipid A 3-O-deacylase
MLRACFVLAVIRFAGAEQPSGVLTLQFENDYFVGEDRNYTHGMRIAYATPVSPRSLVARIGTLFPLIDPNGELRATYSLAQNMFTPDEITRPELIPDDQPYAGWLYAGVGLESERRSHSGTRISDSIELQVGIVGPQSYAEDVQRAWHRFIDTDYPEGWDNQLKNELGVVLYYDRLWAGLAETRLGSDGWKIDLSPHAGFALGNVYTHAAGGATVRFGLDLPDDFGPPYIRPSLPGSDYFTPSRGFAWHLFAGIDVRAVARNIFLDGNTFTDSHSVDKNILIGEAQAGVAFALGRYRLAYTHVIRTPEFDGQDADMFGSLTLSIAF